VLELLNTLDKGDTMAKPKENFKTYNAILIEWKHYPKDKATWELIKKLFNPTNNGRIFF